jgi:hypothetical protein
VWYFIQSHPFLLHVITIYLIFGTFFSYDVCVCVYVYVCVYIYIYIYIEVQWRIIYASFSVTMSILLIANCSCCWCWWGDTVSELQLPVGLLFMPQLIYEYEQPQWNDTDRVMVFDCSNIGLKSCSCMVVFLLFSVFCCFLHQYMLNGLIGHPGSTT